jgi:hypothetical protein
MPKLKTDTVSLGNKEETALKYLGDERTAYVGAWFERVGQRTIRTDSPFKC